MKPQGGAWGNECMDWRECVGVRGLSEGRMVSSASIPAPAVALRQSDEASSLSANAPTRLERH